ncbi:hypothetical protein ACFO4E_26660 [Nocardiopsis mangrovi]|uniref:Oxidoreductase n=1 Tax=Nocardiopsis mangrovi TaxID=1179818 RepID=A0ABV9E5C8_9ACTN
MLTYDDLSPAERELWDAFPEGRWVDRRSGTPEHDDPAGGAQWDAERTVRAAVVSALLLGANETRSAGVPALRLAGARITGSLDMSGAEIDHLLWLKDCHVDEAALFREASTRTIRMTGSRVPGVDAGLARIEGHLDVSGTTMDGDRLSLVNASVTGELLLNGARISAPDEWAVFAGGLVMGGGVFCRDGFRARGGVRLMGAQLPGGLFMHGARLENPDGAAFAADNVTATVLDLSEATAIGTVRLRGARVSDSLTFTGATLKGPGDGGGPAVVCRLMQAVDFDFTVATPPSGSVDLRGAQVSFLHDGDRSWPEVVELDGFAYDSIRPAEAEGAVGRQETVSRRLDWIRRSPGYSPQPYEQLATWYRNIGHDDDARRVLLAKQRHRRRTLHPTGRIWGYLLDVTVGYGYRPWLAGLWLAALTLLGVLVFSTHAPIPAKPGEGSPFNAFIYTVDLLFPIGNFGQRSAWHWAGWAQWLSYLLMAAGWLLTTAVVAGVTRTLNRN